MSGDEAGAKGLYATAALVRNNAEARSAFQTAGGVEVLKRILAGACSLRVQRKAVALAMELAESTSDAMQASIPSAVARPAEQTSIARPAQQVFIDKTVEILQDLHNACSGACACQLSAWPLLCQHVKCMHDSRLEITYRHLNCAVTKDSKLTCMCMLVGKFASQAALLLHRSSCCACM